MWSILGWYGIVLCVGKFDHVLRLVGIGFVVDGWVESTGDWLVDNASCSVAELGDSQSCIPGLGAQQV